MCVLGLNTVPFYTEPSSKAIMFPCIYSNKFSHVSKRYIVSHQCCLQLLPYCWSSFPHWYILVFAHCFLFEPRAKHTFFILRLMYHVPFDLSHRRFQVFNPTQCDSKYILPYISMCYSTMYYSTIVIVASLGFLIFIA